VGTKSRGSTQGRHASQPNVANVIRQIQPEADQSVKETQNHGRFRSAPAALPKQQEMTKSRRFLDRCSPCKHSASSQSGNIGVEFQNELSTNRNVTQTVASTGEVAKRKHIIPFANHASSIIACTHLTQISYKRPFVICPNATHSDNLNETKRFVTPPQESPYLTLYNLNDSWFLVC
jgi:hypothetical protein